MHKRFTDQARQVPALAQDQARLLNHDRLGTEHILLALSRERDGVAGRALGSLGVTPEAVREVLGQAPGWREADPIAAFPKYTRQAGNVLELSLREALRLGDNQVSTEHILLALIREPGAVAAEVLARMSVDPKRVRQQVLRLRHFVRRSPVPGR